MRCRVIHRTARCCGGEAGFGLVEVLVSAGLLVTVAVGVSHVLALAVRANHAARVRTVSTLLAAQKMEQLRSLTWTYAWSAPGIRQPVSDVATDLSSDPPTDTGRGLLSSPPGTLDSNLPLYVDYLNADGNTLGGGTTPPATAVYIRRWAVQRHSADPDNILVLHVLVTTTRTRTGRAGTTWGDARLVTVRTRRP
jgi:hypothetical protein